MAIFRRTLAYHPAPGKLTELRAALLAHPHPGRGMVGEPLAGPSPELRLVHRYDSLAELEQFLAAAGSSSLPALIAPFIAAAPAIGLTEEVLAQPAGPEPAVVSIATFEYVAGRGREVRSLLEERVARRNAAGGRWGINTRVTGGPMAYATVAYYADLAAFEQGRAATIADPANAEELQKLGALLAYPLHAPNVFRVLRRFG
jgi:hypothetical protein